MVLLMVTVVKAGLLDSVVGGCRLGLRVLFLRVGVLVVTILVSLLWEWVGPISPVLGVRCDGYGGV